MRIDVTQQLTDVAGEPLARAESRCEACGQPVTEIPITVRRVAVQALMTPRQGVGGDDKAAHYALAMRFQTEDKPDLRAEDVALLKKLVGELYGPLIVGQMWALLDPPPS